MGIKPWKNRTLLKQWRGKAPVCWLLKSSWTSPVCWESRFAMSSHECASGLTREHQDKGEPTLGPGGKTQLNLHLGASPSMCFLRLARSWCTLPDQINLTYITKDVNGEENWFLTQVLEASSQWNILKLWAILAWQGRPVSHACPYTNTLQIPSLLCQAQKL